jgi:hypothetical protein
MKPLHLPRLLTLFCIVGLFNACQKSPTWQSIGPSSETFLLDYLPCAGRVDAMAFSENFDGNGTSAMYIGGPGSGVWRSADFESGNPNWVPLTDHITMKFNDAIAARDFHQDINTIQTIVVDPTNNRRIYAGTFYSHSVILRSEDGGSSWSVIGSSTFSNKTGATKLFVDPTGTLYMTGAGGLWQQTSPGANTFTNLAIQGTNPPPPGVEFHDAAYVSNGTGQPITVYVAIVDRNTTGRPASGIWSYFNGNWSMMQVNMTNLQGLPFFSADINRIKMYSSPTGEVVAAMTSDNGALRNLKGALLNVFKLQKARLPDRVTFSWQPQWTSSTVIFNTQGQNNDMGTCIDHNGTIYSGGVGFGQSDGNGGVVGCQPAIPDGHHNIHVDEHAIVEYKNKIYIATDGGIFNFEINEGTIPGFHFYGSLNTYSLRNFLSTSVARNNNGGDFLAGNQDNGMTFIPYGINGSVNAQISNEAEWIRFVPYNVGTKYQAIAYSWSPQRGFYKSIDGGQTFTEPHLPVDVNNGLYCFHPTENGRMLLNVILNKTINNASVQVNSVYETRNNWLDQPKEILANASFASSTPSALCYSGENILVGINSNIFLSPDDGATWKQVWTNDARIVAIRSDPSNPNEIFFATDKFQRAGDVFHASIGTNPTDQWQNVIRLSGNLVGEVNQLELLTSGAGKPPYLYISQKDLRLDGGMGGPGVYEATSLDGDNTVWQIFGTGLPDANVTDLQIIPAGPGTGMMLAATWGRGAWQIPIVSH